jgi:hypothetical protein
MIGTLFALHDFPRKTLDRQIGGIEDVTVRVDDAVDPGGAGCAKLGAGNAASAANAIPPATNSRRRIVHLVRTLPKAIWHGRIVQV